NLKKSQYRKRNGRKEIQQNSKNERSILRGNVCVGRRVTMSNHAKNVSERAFQDNFVQELKKYKWQAPDFLDGNKQKVTVQDLVNHWRGELNRINADVLEGIPLTDNEFRQVMA